MRTCGPCTACCWVGSVPGLKEEYSFCEHQTEAGCSVHDQPRHRVCESFQCAWLRGVGSEEDRPDLSGVMCAVNEVPSGTFTFAVELQQGAVLKSGAGMLSSCVRAYPFPVIISSFGRRPPDDSGDMIAADPSSPGCSRRNIGKPLRRLAPDVYLHQLVTK